MEREVETEIIEGCAELILKTRPSHLLQHITNYSFACRRGQGGFPAESMGIQ